MCVHCVGFLCIFLPHLRACRKHSAAYNVGFVNVARRRRRRARDLNMTAHHMGAHSTWWCFALFPQRRRQAHAYNKKSAHRRAHTIKRASFVCGGIRACAFLFNMFAYLYMHGCEWPSGADFAQTILHASNNVCVCVCVCVCLARWMTTDGIIVGCAGAHCSRPQQPSHYLTTNGLNLRSPCWNGGGGLEYMLAVSVPVMCLCFFLCCTVRRCDSRTKEARST